MKNKHAELGIIWDSNLRTAASFVQHINVAQTCCHHDSDLLEGWALMSSTTVTLLQHAVISLAHSICQLIALMCSFVCLVRARS